MLIHLVSSMAIAGEAAALEIGLSFAQIADHPRFRDAKLGIIVSSLRALQLFELPMGARLLDELLGDDAVLAAMGRRASTIAAERFSVERCHRAYESLL